MFLIDKYTPTMDSNIFFHKELIELLNIMSRDEAIPHIIFYGNDGTGKKTMIKLFLEMLFDSSVNKLSTVEYSVTGSGNKVTKEKVKKSNYHIVINPKNNNYDRYLIHDIVKEYAKRKTLGVFKTNRAFKVVLINSIDNMSYYAQTSLRRTMERYNDKCRFIMWCKSLSKVIEPLQSRCICLRIPSPSDEEMFKYIFQISIKEQINLSLEQYTDLVRKSHGNIKKALWELEFHRFNYSLSTDYTDSIQKIIDLVLTIDLSTMLEIRNVIFNLIITNFDGTTIMTDLIDGICASPKISDESKQKIVNEGAEIEYQLVKCRREIIQFDALISSIIKILKDERKNKRMKKMLGI